MNPPSRGLTTSQPPNAPGPVDYGQNSDHPREGGALKAPTINEIIPTLIGITFPLLISIAGIITEPVCADHAPTLALLWITRRTMVRTEVQDRTVARFHRRTGDLQTVRLIVPVRRTRVRLAMHALLGEKIDALEILIQFV